MTQSERVKMSDFEELNVLGEGAYAPVVRVRKRHALPKTGVWDPMCDNFENNRNERNIVCSSMAAGGRIQMLRGISLLSAN